MLEMIKQGLGDAVPFVRHVGVELLEVGQGEASARIEDDERLKNHVGTYHAGALFTLGETASGAAVAGAFASRILEVLPVVGTARIQYLKPARNSVTAFARTDRDAETMNAQLDTDGRVATDVKVTLRDANDVEVAIMNVEWIVRKRRAAPAPQS